MHAYTASDMIVLYKTQQLYIIKHSPGPFLSETQLWPVANPYNRHWTDRQCDHILYSLESTPTYLCCNRYCSSQGLIPRLCWRRKWPENKATVMNCRYDATTSMKISAFKILRFEISARSTRLYSCNPLSGRGGTGLWIVCLRGASLLSVCPKGASLWNACPQWSFGARQFVWKVELSGKNQESLPWLCKISS